MRLYAYPQTRRVRRARPSPGRLGQAGLHSGGQRMPAPGPAAVASPVGVAAGPVWLGLPTLLATTLAAVALLPVSAARQRRD